MEPLSATTTSPRTPLLEERARLADAARDGLRLVEARHHDREFHCHVANRSTAQAAARCGSRIKGRVVLAVREHRVHRGVVDSDAQRGRDHDARFASASDPGQEVRVRGAGAGTPRSALAGGAELVEGLPEAARRGERFAERDAVLGAPRLQPDEVRELLGRLRRTARLHEHLGDLEVEHRVGPDRARGAGLAERRLYLPRLQEEQRARPPRSAGSRRRSAASPRLRRASAGRPLSASFSACIHAATRLCGAAARGRRTRRRYNEDGERGEEERVPAA